MSHFLVNVDLNNVSHGGDNFDDDSPETIIHVRRMVWCNRYKQCKACKKEISKKLVTVAWHPTRYSIGACQKMKKRNRIIFDC